MKFKTYIKESVAPITEEQFEHPDSPSLTRETIDAFYAPVEKLIKEGKFEEAAAEIADLEKDLAEFEAENAKKKIFKFPKFMIDGQKKQLAALKAKLPKTESLDDMNKRCETCNTLLNDQGTCPKCDDGEEDYNDEINEELSNKEKLMKAFPGEFNFDTTVTESAQEVIEEDISVREKLKRAYPELNFESPVSEAVETNEELSNREKLKKAYPELNLESCVKEDVDPEQFDYDDVYDIDDDVEQDRRHAALYGGDRMYCKCGTRLKMDEWGSYCPDCNPEKEIYDDEV